MNIYCNAKRAAHSASANPFRREEKSLCSQIESEFARAAGERRSRYKLSTFLLIILAALVTDFHIFIKRLSKVGGGFGVETISDNSLAGKVVKVFFSQDSSAPRVRWSFLQSRPERMQMKREMEIAFSKMLLPSFISSHEIMHLLNPSLSTAMPNDILSQWYHLLDPLLLIPEKLLFFNKRKLDAVLDLWFLSNCK